MSAKGGLGAGTGDSDDAGGSIIVVMASVDGKGSVDNCCCFFAAVRFFADDGMVAGTSEVVLNKLNVGPGLEELETG
jgi:hypothetical protein